MTEREKFEAWFENDVVGMKVTFPVFEDGEYAEGDLYDAQLYFTLQAMWMSWKAATASTQEQMAALAAEIVNLQKFCKKASFDADCEAEIGMERGGFTDALNDIKTPATDAFIADQQAIGVDSAVNAAKNVVSEEFQYTDFEAAQSACYKYPESDLVGKVEMIEWLSDFAQQLRDEVKP